MNEIEFEVRKGQSLAIVGHNGAGKSTLVKLLLRFYDPDKGRIALNGIDIRQFKICELRNCFSVVFQDFQIYSYTVAENILMRIPDNELDEQLVWDALKKVKLDEKIRMLQNGIHTYITKELDEHGVMFSGGEMQRLAIARAIVKDAPIIILDEPSSSLDPLAEAEISEILFEQFNDKIVVIISHRLSMTKNAGHIVVLDDGKIVEQGNHNELIQCDGVYAKMWDSQAKKYQKSM